MMLDESIEITHNHNTYPETSSKKFFLCKNGGYTILVYDEMTKTAIRIWLTLNMNSAHHSKVLI